MYTTIFIIFLILIFIYIKNNIKESFINNSPCKFNSNNYNKNIIFIPTNMAVEPQINKYYNQPLNVNNSYQQLSNIQNTNNKCYKSVTGIFTTCGPLPSSEWMLNILD